MSRPIKAVPMCCVTINYVAFLMPADKGMKLVELLQSAFDAHKDYRDRGYIYQIGEQPSVEFCLVRASQLKTKPTDINAAGQRLLGRAE